MLVLQQQRKWWRPPHGLLLAVKEWGAHHFLGHKHRAQTNESGHVFYYDDLAISSWSGGLHPLQMGTLVFHLSTPAFAALCLAQHGSTTLRGKLTYPAIAARKPNWSPGTAKPLPKFLAVADRPMIGMKPHQDLMVTQSQLRSSHQSLFHVYIPCLCMFVLHSLNLYA